MSSIHIIPQPASISVTEGFLTCPKDSRPEFTGDSLFAAEITTANRQTTLACTTALPAVKIGCVFDPLVEGSEAYELDIGTDSVTLRASASAGMYHGMQSVRQIFLAAAAEPGAGIPCAHIEDRPRFAWRGCMLDTSRHFYTVAFIKKLIDLASLHHLNVFHWHLTDDQGWRLPVDKYPGLTETGAWRDDRRSTWGSTVGGFYSKEDIREIVAFAAERQVQVVPEVDLPGHASAILAAYPGLGCTGGPYRVEDRFGIFEDVLCAGNDDIFTLFEAVFDSLAELFPSPYVHIGGDEVKFGRWEACPKCRARMQELSLDTTQQLQSWITVRLVEMLRARGRTAIGWDEVLEGTETFTLPQDLVVMSWRGREGGLEASAKGHRVIMTPMTDGCYLNFKPLDNGEEPGHLEVCTVRQSYGMESVPAEMSAAQEALVLGGQCNLWSEVIYASRIAEYMLFPRLCAVAESLWSPKEKRSLESFARRLPAHRALLDRLDVCQYRGPLE